MDPAIHPKCVQHMERDAVSVPKVYHISAVYRSSKQAVHELEEFEHRQVDMVNTDLIHSYAKCSGIIAKLKPSSFDNNVNV